MNTHPKISLRSRRRARVRAKIFGTSECPRLSVFKSNKYLYAQIVDDTRGLTLAYESSAPAKKKPIESKGKTAEFLGQSLARQALAKKIERVVFDRGGFLYTGKIKQLADSARAAGLKF